MRWSPQALARITGGALVRDAGREVAGAFLDSRTPIPGGLFVPIVAARDGHDFIPAAIASGAAATLIARGRPRPDDPRVSVIEVDDPLTALERLAADARARCDGPVVAITGSNGKTTTRAMIAAALEVGFAPVLATQGNFNNHLGVPLTLVRELEGGAAPRAMVIELGMSAPGEVDALAALVRPTCAVITSVALEHLEFMGSLDAIARAEAEVVARVRPGGRVLVPGDEPALTPYVSREGVALQGFGAGELYGAPIVEVVAVEVGVRTRVTLAIEGHGRETFSLQTFGAHNARNAAAAVSVALAHGLPIDAVCAALERVAPVGDRGRVIALGEHLLVADCYNANPGSVKAGLAGLAAFVDVDRRIAVLGDMLELGPDEEALHAEVGREAAALGIDALLTVGPRSRHAALAAGAVGHHLGDALALPEATAAVTEALAGSRRAAVLIKGSRGMALERLCEALVAARGDTP
ncbi:MAG: UDP-N-acetylmuramoyl-tripeptide--D-alanyl-D-alanine ligase [Nannocystaceae bacterium]